MFSVDLVFVSHGLPLLTADAGTDAALGDILVHYGEFLFYRHVGLLAARADASLDDPLGKTATSERRAEWRQDWRQVTSDIASTSGYDRTSPAMVRRGSA
jgi:hypothetical protein